MRVFSLAAVVAASVPLALTGVASAVTPVFDYQFPDSWDGSEGTPVVDLSPAGNNGTADASASLSSDVPPGAPAGSMSLDGGVNTDAADLLTNDAVAAAGGFSYETSFLWDGTTNNFDVLKIIDYAGTESLQVAVDDTGDTPVGTLEMVFSDDVAAAHPIVPIEPNTWYDVLMTFDTQGNSVDGEGALAGLASLIVNGGDPVSESVVKTNFGDSLDRAIGVGRHPAFDNILDLNGLVHSARVSLGVVPEPATLSLLALSSLAVLRRR